MGIADKFRIKNAWEASRACSFGDNVVECGQVKRFGFIIVSLLSCLCACSVRQHIRAATDKINSMYASTKDWMEVPERRITWHQAVSMLRESNLELLEAEDQIRQAERNSRSIYTDLIPGVSYYGYMTRSIANLADSVSAEDLNSRINVTFSVPALTQVPYRVYAAQVATFAAVKAKEGRERELISKLYQLVRKREIEEAKQALADPKQVEESDGKRQLLVEQAQERYWQEISRLLGNREARWYVLPESMPHVRWEDYNARLDRLGELVACEFALRLERTRLSQYGVALSYLPTINTSIYSPSLFSSSGGTYEGTFLSAEDTRINMSISYSLDTKLTSWDSFQQSKARYEREKVRVANELMDHKAKVRLLRKSMAEYVSWRGYMLKRMAYLRSAAPEDAEEVVEKVKNLRSMQLELLNQESAALESEAAVVLEYGMPDEPEKRPSSKKKK